MSSRDKTPGEIADIIEHFVYRGPAAQQARYDLEWYGLLDGGVSDPTLDPVVKQCELINREYIPERSESEAAKVQREQNADERLKKLAAQFREMERKVKE